MKRFLGRAARRWLPLVAALLVLALPSQALEAVPDRGLLVERPESDVMLLAVRLDQTLLADALPSYLFQGHVLVPLGELCRLLGLGIEVDATRGLATGFFIGEERLFRLDIASRQVLVEGKAMRFDPTGIEAHRDDLYVDTALLSEWLPLGLSVDLHGAFLTVRPGERLPLQLRLERESKLGKGREDPAASSAGLPKTALAYRLFDGPFVDQTLQWAHQAAPGGSRSELQSSTYATGDLLFAEANAYIAGSGSTISDSRFSLGRKDPEGNLLGVLGAREVTVGDVFHPGLDLIALPRSGPGLLISNYPLQLPAQFDRQSFRGDLPPGWEVELYRGEELLAYAPSRPDGLYEFLDVPLLFGLNEFRLEFYGPQGQRRSETQRLNVGDTLTPKGKVYYRLVGNNPGAGLLGTGVPDAGARSTLEVSAGLTRNLSASVSGGSVDLADGRHSYAAGGLRAFWGSLFADAEVAKEKGGGSAWQGTLQSRVGPFGLLIQRAELDRFVSEPLLSDGAPLRSRTRLRLDTTLPGSFLPRLPVIVELRQDQLENGQRLDQLTARISAFSHGLSVANQVIWTASSGGGSPLLTNATGQLLVSKFLPAFALRGELDYGMMPQEGITGAFLTADVPVRSGLLLSAGVSRVFLGGQTRVFTGVSKLEGAFGYSLTADYSHPGGLGALLLVSAGIGRDARNGTWHSQARALAGSGALSGLAFLDLNGNGRMDAGETPIAGAGFLLNGGGNLARTDDSGETFIPNLSPYQEVGLALAPSSLEDPFWKPASDGVRVVPRPGKVAVIDFPVQVSGEITGTIYLKRDGVPREVGGVELQLVDRQGFVVRKVSSGYDGFYDLAEIRPGHYTLMVAAEQLARLRLLVAPTREVEMAPMGTVLDGIDFVLEE